MIGGKKILTNTVLLVFSSIFNLGVSLITTALIARTLGPELYGKYTFGLSYIFLFSVLANFGLESLFIREAARDRNKIREMVMDILHLKAVLAILTIVVIIVSIHLLQYPTTTINIVYILCVGLFFQIVHNSVICVYKSVEKMSVIAFFGIAFRIVSAIIIVGSVYWKLGLVGIVWAFSIGNIVVFFGSMLVYYKDFRLLSLKPRLRIWPGLIRRGSPFYFSALLTMVYLKINVVMLSKMRGELEVGYYMAAATLVESLFFIPDAFNTSIFPAFSRIYGISFDALRRTYERAIKYIILLTAAVCFGTILTGERIVLLIYGDEFLASVSALKVLIFFFGFRFFSSIMSSLLFSIKKEKMQAKAMGTACVSCVILNFVLIREYGFMGSAFAVLVSEALGVVIMGVILWRGKLKYLPQWDVVRLIVVVLAMIFTIKALEKVHVLVSIAGGAACYILLLFLLRVFDSDDLRAIKSIRSK